MDTNFLIEEASKIVENRICTLKNEIEMATRTIGEVVLKDSETAEWTIDQLKDSIETYREEIEFLERAKESGTIKELIFGPEKKVYYEKKTEEGEKLKQGVVGNICGYDIFEPILENSFLVKFPESLGIQPNDVMSYEILDNALVIVIRNNVTCPLLKIEPLLKNEFLNQKIEIETIDKTGCVLYTTVFDIEKLFSYEISGGDYSSSKPQTITLRFCCSEHKIIEPNKE